MTSHCLQPHEKWFGKVTEFVVREGNSGVFLQHDVTIKPGGNHCRVAVRVAVENQFVALDQVLRLVELVDVRKR